jgi:hypothetical protein
MTQESNNRREEGGVTPTKSLHISSAGNCYDAQGFGFWIAFYIGNKQLRLKKTSKQPESDKKVLLEGEWVTRHRGGGGGYGGHNLYNCGLCLGPGAVYPPNT